MRLSDRKWANLTSVLGTCSRCTKRAFLLASGLWALTACTAALSSDTVTIAMTCLAGLLTLWWLAHATFQAARSGGSWARRTHDAGRRRSILFLRAVAGALAISVLPRSAHAGGACGGENCQPCQRPFYGGNGGWQCIPCQTCVDQNGTGCGGNTC